MVQDTAELPCYQQARHIHSMFQESFTEGLDLRLESPPKTPGLGALELESLASVLGQSAGVEPVVDSRAHTVFTLS